MMLLQSVNKSLNELAQILIQLSDDEYCLPCIALSNSSIGEHSRHIIEMFQCLEKFYESGIINYEKRERNVLIQNHTSHALFAIDIVKENFHKKNKKLLLQQDIGASQIKIESNYFRELLYNLEHCIHHQALIKVALMGFESIDVNKNFGVAPSTIEYRMRCAQ